jgi:hypothetical protein
MNYKFQVFSSADSSPIENATIMVHYPTPEPTPLTGFTDAAGLCTLVTLTPATDYGVFKSGFTEFIGQDTPPQDYLIVVTLDPLPAPPLPPQPPIVGVIRLLKGHQPAGLAGPLGLWHFPVINKLLGCT